MVLISIAPSLNDLFPRFLKFISSGISSVKSFSRGLNCVQKLLITNYIELLYYFQQKKGRHVFMPPFISLRAADYPA